MSWENLAHSRLFQFALTDLFDRRVAHTLTLDTYRAMGGVDGALSRKAEYLYEGLSNSEQEAARQVFLRLVTLTDTHTRTRRRVAAAELLSLDLTVTDLQAVLDAFGSQRLLTFDRNDVTGSPTVEVRTRGDPPSMGPVGTVDLGCPDRRAEQRDTSDAVRRLVDT